jgi:hypothetical protein
MTDKTTIDLFMAVNAAGEWRIDTDADQATQISPMKRLATPSAPSRYPSASHCRRLPRSPSMSPTKPGRPSRPMGC